MQGDVREISVSFDWHSKTGLIVATSSDLPGLIVHGRTHADLDRAIPDAIKALLEAQLNATVIVEKSDDSVNGGPLGGGGTSSDTVQFVIMILDHVIRNLEVTNAFFVYFLPRRPTLVR